MKIDLEEKMKEIKKAWFPLDVAKANGQVVRLALFEGEFHWHTHEFDELFYVVKGKITIQMRGKGIILKKGQMAIIPKGVEHCPKGLKPSYVLMFEPSE